jgi:hypothetical protein
VGPCIVGPYIVGPYIVGPCIVGPCIVGPYIVVHRVAMVKERDMHPLKWQKSGPNMGFIKVACDFVFVMILCIC